MAGYDLTFSPVKSVSTSVMINNSPRSAPAVCSVPEAMALLNLSRTQIFERIRTSGLVTVTQGRRRLVPADSITDYVQRLLAECRAGAHGDTA